MRVIITEEQHMMIKENEQMSLQLFYKKHNITEDDLSWLGSGEFGDAYSTGDGRVVKITSSKSEFSIAKEIINSPMSFSGFAKFYDAQVTDKGMVILVEELEIDSDIEDKFYSLVDLLEHQELPIQYLGYFDADEYIEEYGEIDSELLEFMDAIDNINRDYRNLGIEASDIRPENLGYSSTGELKAFDIDDKKR